MSITSFLSKIWDSLKSLFNGMPAELKTAIHVGVVVVENIKAFTDSSYADLLTAIIPGDLDDKIKELLRAKLPVILQDLKLVDATLGLTDPNEIVAAALKALDQISGDVKSAFLHNLAILTAQVAADGKLSWSDGVYILEWYYQHQYDNAA